MRQLPAEEKAKIAKLNEGLRMEKNRLVTEVSKWDDQSNEIIVLAKKMCMIMMDMSDFTRYIVNRFVIFVYNIWFDIHIHASFTVSQEINLLN